MPLDSVSVVPPFTIAEAGLEFMIVRGLFEILTSLLELSESEVDFFF